LKTFLVDVEECLRRRNEIVHSLVVAHFADDKDPEWNLVHPRSGQARTMLTAEEADELIERMYTLANGAMLLTGHAAKLRADSCGLRRVTSCSVAGQRGCRS
jgi:hypothetical protein